MQKENNNGRRRVTAARSSLIMEQAFFGSLAMKMDLIEDPTAKKMWTDMRSIGFNPQWAMEATHDELKARICEIVMHNANGHPWRRNGKDSKDWNIACDYSLWGILKESGFALPDDVYYNAKFAGMSAEGIYGIIHDEKKKEKGRDPGNDPGGQPGDEPSEGGDDDPGSGGEVRDPPKPEEVPALEGDWKVAVLQAAAAAKARGQMPAGMEQLVESIKHPAIDWKAALRKWIQQNAKNDYSWRLPNRRYAAQGVYLPELRSEQMPPIAYYWDTSGSRDDQEARAECAAELAEIAYEVKPERIYVIYGDAQVQHVDVFEQGEEITFNPKGGGGTDFRPIFEYIAKENLEIACFVGITDLEGSFPDEAPEYPVLWAATENHEPPFGTALRIHPTQK